VFAEPEDGDLGRIVTFYSFKGGVGRSMALANVGFLAAMNGLRVLVMDWDLEAPGLGYYFRGLVEPQEARALKAAPGILNLVWDWIETIRRTDDGSELLRYFERFDSGIAFDELVRPLFDLELEEGPACLDILRAGSAQIGEGHTYEEALATISWPTFFTADAGGILLSALRSWAKSNYDLVLIDSRTGLADVAGICTMQLPDEVALCFILNRQNMEGIAQVAGAIRAKREEQVTLRAIPMRIASQGTSEEASARARARRELTTIGGFAGDAVDEDFRALAIGASPNVPFYEALAPIIASDPLTDPLSQNYLRVASELLGRELKMPALYENWVERVRRRLQPKHATSSYLLELRTQDPERALLEMSHLVESALDAQFEHDAELDDDYIETLVKAAAEISDEAASPYEAIELLNQSLDLLRARILEGGSQFKPFLIDMLTKVLDYSGLLNREDEQALLDEFDSLVAGDPTISTRLLRLRFRRRAARIHVSGRETEAAFQAIADIQKLIDSLDRNSLSPDQAAIRLAGEVDIHLLRGMAYLNDSPDRAVVEFRRGYDLASAYQKADGRSEGRSELSRLRTDLAINLAVRLEDHLDVEERAHFALEAVRMGSTLSYGGLQFSELAAPILEVGDDEMVLQFVQAAFRPERAAQFANSQARLTRTSRTFFVTATRLLQRLMVAQLPGWEDAARDAARVSLLVIRYVSRRQATVTIKAQHELSAELQALRQLLLEIGITEADAEFGAAATMLAKPAPARRKGRRLEGDGT
jgi:cellulose biosynthesis protein BcsQ